ncbi:MAG: ubiquinone biosynthesis protein COQ4 [Proteobacteria bacterium]|nr:ubiquinone biosynthesis protein COQ4 [Pseudomonadota bacterium]
MKHQSVVTNPRKLGPIGFVRELRRARRTGPSPETVFRLLRPFHGPELDAIYGRCMNDPTARRILEEGKSLHPVLLDFDRLRALPEGSLGHEYARFMDDNDIDIVSFAEASWKNMVREDYANDAAWALANRLRDIHEIVHVISGYGTDVLGEMCELVFNIREDPRPKAAWLAVKTNIVKFRRMGAPQAEAVIREAHARGQQAGLMVGTDWEALLDWPLDDVRQKLHISPPPSYTPIPGPGDPPLPRPTPRDLLSALLLRTPTA